MPQQTTSEFDDRLPSARGAKQASAPFVWEEHGSDEERGDSDYAFPVIDVSFDPLAREAPNQVISRLTELRDPRRDYSSQVRSDYCRLHLTLNLRAAKARSVAPRFRPLRRPPPRQVVGDYRSDQINLSNDNQVIDLHWLYVTGHEVVGHHRATQLFAGNTFDFELAAELVATIGDVQTKRRELELYDDEEWECASLQRAETRKQWKDLQDETIEVKHTLSSRARRHHQLRGQVEEWTSLYLAMRIEETLAGPSGVCSAAGAARWFERITGREMSRQRAGRKLKALRRHLPAH